MRIGELARRSGVSQRLLRYYEEQGLLEPQRLESGYRSYEESDIRTVRNIRTLLSAGLNTATIAQVLPCMEDYQQLLALTCPDGFPRLVRERDRMSTAIEELTTARDVLDSIITAPRPAAAAG